MRSSTYWLLSLGTIFLSGALGACGSEPEQKARPDGDESAPAGSAGSAVQRARAARGARSITLITGDRVIAHGKDRFTVEPGPGRQRGAHRTFSVKGHTYIIPFDAVPLLADGQLDRRLFDVTELLDLGYDDARRADLPLIVVYGPGVDRSAASMLAAAGVPRGLSLASINAEAVRAPKTAAPALWSRITAGGRRSALAAHGVGKIWLDGKRKPVLDQSAVQVGAPTAWAAGYTGAGVKVAVLDTGILDTHPDFAGRIVDAQNFLDDGTGTTDGFGHGTHVTSILAGSGAGQDGTYRGVAPDAEIYVGKVCNDFGSCPESAIIAGMEWAAESGASVVNLSLGGFDTPEIDPLEQAINDLTAAHGTLFVVAAGNSGPGPSTIESPGSAEAALTVGAVTKSDESSFFSSRGPRVGDGGLKPDISAPGVDIAAARAPGTLVGDSDPVNDLYSRASGTSMATPHVAGAAAILIQQHPEWRAEQLKSALMNMAHPNAALGVFEEGSGRLDVGSAIAAVVTASASVHFGRASWPHEDDEPIARTVTYHNRGAEPITLDLALAVDDPAGAPAPAAMFTVAPTALTVPAGGEAQATITAHPSQPGPDGVYSGALTASGAGASVRTIVGLDREVESYQLDIVFEFRDPSEGEPFFSGAFAMNLDTADFLDLGTENRLPAGRFHLQGDVLGGEPFTQDPDIRFYHATFIQPLLELDHDQTITMDARAAQPTRVTVPHPTARRAQENWAYIRNSETPELSISLFTGALYTRHPDEEDYSPIYTQHFGPEVPDNDFWMTFGATWAEPGPVDTPFDWSFFADSPYAFWINFVAGHGRAPTGIEWEIEEAELATVENDYAVSGPTIGAESFVDSWRIDSNGTVSISTLTLPFHTPTHRVEHFASTDEIGWSLQTAEFNEFYETAHAERLTVFEPGTTRHVAWGKGVLGPSMTADFADFGPIEFDFQPGLYRLDDLLQVAFPTLYSDSSGHYGFGLFETGSLRLFRNGILIGESGIPNDGIFEVPLEPANYRVQMRSLRGGSAELSTEVHLTWGFRSEGTDGEVIRIPVSAIDINPSLDEFNSAPAGQSYILPMQVSRTPGVPAAPLTRLRLDVSYDGGATWQQPPLIRTGDLAFALLVHPDEELRVSLRVSAADEDGNALSQTILNAYRLRTVGVRGE